MFNKNMYSIYTIAYILAPSTLLYEHDTLSY